MPGKQNTDQLVVDEIGQYVLFPLLVGTRKSGPIGLTEADRVTATIRSGQIEPDIHQQQEGGPWKISDEYLRFRVQEELVAEEQDSSDAPILGETKGNFLE